VLSDVSRFLAGEFFEASFWMRESKTDAVVALFFEL
jgi:hypothetical protein